VRNTIYQEEIRATDASSTHVMNVCKVSFVCSPIYSISLSKRHTHVILIQRYFRHVWADEEILKPEYEQTNRLHFYIIHGWLTAAQLTTETR
jgi:hypothetical protein